MKNVFKTLLHKMFKNSLTLTDEKTNANEHHFTVNQKALYLPISHP